MSKTKTIGDRLRMVSVIVGGVNKLADEWGMAAPGLYNYFKGRTKPGTEVLQRLYQMGIGLEWLITGNGLIFANNDAGRRLRNNYAKEEKIELPKDDVHSRLRYFASTNFESTEEFGKQLGKTESEIKPFFESRKPTISMLEDLASLGCNTNWLLQGAGFDINPHPGGDSPMTVDAARNVYLKVTYSKDQFSVQEVSADSLSDEERGSAEASE